MPKYKKIPDNENAIELDGKVVMSFDPRYKEYLKWRNENPELEKELQEELDKDLTVDRLYNNGAPHKEVSPLSELLTYNIEIWTWYDEDGKLKLKSEIQDEEHHGKTWEYFSNGTLKSEINYEKGEMNGDFAEFEQDGTRVIEGKYEKGERVGEWTFRYPNGKLKWKGTYLNDIVDGELRQYDEAGNIFSIENFNNGILHGDFEYYQNGKLRETGTMLDNKKHGEIRAYWINQKLKRIENFKSGIANGEFKEFFISGDLMSEGKTELGLPRGTWKWYYESALLKREIIYGDDGIRTKSTEWGENGNKKYEQNWNGNIQHGKCMYWNKEGKIVKDYNYKNGKLDGNFADYYLSGAKRAKGKMKFDMMIGKWTFWYHNNKKEVECDLELGTPTGVAKIWHDNGTLKQEVQIDPVKKVYDWDSHKI